MGNLNQDYPPKFKKKAKGFHGLTFFFFFFILNLKQQEESCTSI